MDARIDDLETGLEEIMHEKADFLAIRQAVAPIIQEHPSVAIAGALEFIRQKERKTLAEAEALDAFEHIKIKPVRTK
jgi:hypothetical protein